MPSKIKDPAEWLKTRYKLDVETGCWDWIGAKYRNGYGSTKVIGTRRSCMAHRLSYLILRGAIDETLVLDHLCRNRACINPDHLEQVTQAENLRRAGTILRIISSAKERGSRPTCPKGHPLSGENLYTYPSNPTHRACRICMREYRQRAAKQKREGSI